MISKLFGLTKISEDNKSIIYIKKRTWWQFIPFLLLFFSFYLLFIYGSLVKLFLFFSIFLIIFLVMIQTIVFFEFFKARMIGRQILGKAIDYSKTKMTIIKGNEKGFLKYSVSMDISALRGNTKGLNKLEESFANTTYDIFKGFIKK
jgi:uncharacterized metal-binding protein